MHLAHARYAAEAESDPAILARHGDLVARAARRLAARTGGAVSPDDLWSAGAVGLLDAARRFDAGREVRFETYAEHRIRGAMLDELRRMDHLPRRMRAQVERVEQARGRLTRTLQREPAPEELAAAACVGLEELGALTALSGPHASSADELVSPLAPADEELERGQQAAALAEAVAGLPERLQVMLSLHYVEGLTYRDVARLLDVSEPRVCQLHADALRRLRAALGRDGTTPTSGGAGASLTTAR